MAVDDSLVSCTMYVRSSAVFSIKSKSKNNPTDGSIDNRHAIATIGKSA